MAGTKAWSCIVLLLLPAVVAAKATLPEPPQQHLPWKQPSVIGIPNYVVTLAALLFDAGLADPRGGSYREIELQGIKTHGWVFDQKYAVCWDGLVYPVRSVGAAANIEQDVRTIQGANPGSSGLLLRSSSPAPEAAFWFDMGRFLNLVPASIALLLRLDRPDLAAQLWRAPESSDPLATVHSREPNEAEWHSTSLRAWLGMAFRRLTDARGRDDDQDAVDVGESLMEWRARTSAHVRDLSFLEPVPALLADSKRRLREPARQPVDFSTDDKGNHAAAYSAFLQRSQAVRIADLIDRLEDIRAEKMTIPGALMFSFEPICELLSREGEAAVEPLLDVYEHDKRLTRTLDYVRSWSLERTPIPVSEVAKVILSDILQSKDLADGYSPASLRAWWEKHKTSSVAERNFEVLADDHASADRWLASAHFITLRSDVRPSDGSATVGEDCNPQKAVPAPHGEELRMRTGASVGELLAKRVASLVDSKSEVACGLAFAAFLWDSKESLPVLQNASTLEACRADSRVTAARMSLSDPQAAVDWSATIRDRAAKPGLLTSDLAPLWIFPDDPALSKTAERLFAGPEAPLSPAVKFQVIYSPLLAVPAYRRAVLSTLNDSSVVGKATRSLEGVLSYQFKNGGGGGGAPGNDPRQVPPGQERPVRVKDLTALELTTLDGAPEFQPDWPEFDKDTAITEITEFLRMHEKELRAFPGRPQDMTCPGESVYLKR
jgi:hypothetical protein